MTRATRRPVGGGSRSAPLLVALTVLAGACGSSDDGFGDRATGPDASAGAMAGAAADRCIVRLHGKGESGAAPTVVDGVAVLAPDGNGTGWGGRQWEYADDAALAAARARISTAADDAGCQRVVVHGFSNGASMAAALYCSGDDLSGRLVGVVVDDPVTDAATVECTPADMEVALYWTGALDAIAPPGTDCSGIDWTCAGGIVRGVDAYSVDLGVVPLDSPFDEHRWYLDSPLPLTWLG